MTGEQIVTLAHQTAPYLDWCASVDGQNGMGTSLPFAGATVSTTMGPGTINITNIGGVWVAELVLRKGSAAVGPESTLLMQSANHPTIGAAFTELLAVARAAASMLQGLEEAEGRYSKTDAGRLNALGLVAGTARISLGES